MTWSGSVVQSGFKYGVGGVYWIRQFWQESSNLSLGKGRWHPQDGGPG